LPAAGWKGLGFPVGTKGFRFKDGDKTNGMPCKAVVIKPGNLLKAACKANVGGDALAFDLDEPQQSSMRVSLELGAGTDGRYCVVFGPDGAGGDVKVDRPATPGSSGLFKVTNAPAPASCP
jgi:hypothetical protein